MMDQEITSKHTPGPWDAVAEPAHGNYDNGGFRIDGPDTEQIAFVWNANVRYGTADHFGSKNGQADARLIAAAPTMYEELDRLRAVNADLLATLSLATEWLGNLLACRACMGALLDAMPRDLSGINALRTTIARAEKENGK